MSRSNLLPAERIERRILLVRGQKVLLDFQLAELYGVTTKALNQAVKRNLERFPEDFMFRLTLVEAAAVFGAQISDAARSKWSQLVTSSDAAHAEPMEAHPAMWSQPVTTSPQKRRMGNLPYAFTEQGVAMLSSVLRSQSAIQVNIAIMRTFVQLRRWLSTHDDLARKLDALERNYDVQFKSVFDAIRELMKRTTPGRKPKREIGFHTLLVNDPQPKPKSRTRKPSP